MAEKRKSKGERQRIAALKRSPAYQRAYEDLDFLRQTELRPVRLQLELLKPEMVQNQKGINSTIVVFGSARIEDPDVAKRRLDAAERALKRFPGHPAKVQAVRAAKHSVAFSKYYDEARRFSRIVSSTCQIHGKCDYVTVTGGGPGIMEAANRGADDAGAISVGLNITLPHEQEPNSYITPELCFQFHYFAIRKMHFLLRARALVVFPGGFGTCDELFETLTLIQTGKMPAIPVILFGRKFWERLIDFRYFEEQGLISPGDRDLFQFAETAEEAWQIIMKHNGAPNR